MIGINREELDSLRIERVTLNPKKAISLLEKIPPILDEIDRLTAENAAKDGEIERILYELNCSQRALKNMEESKNDWKELFKYHKRRAEALERAILALPSACSICDSEPSNGPNSPCSFCREGDLQGWSLAARFSGAGTED
jgi:DNA repair exonuclease SbcCD ATPase subunit